MNKILVAGATGYLGRHIVKQLLSEDRKTSAIVRKANKLDDFTDSALEVIEAEVTKPGSLKGVMEGVDTVISTVGITRQKDGLSYEQVDYQANKNLLDEAVRNGVRKFIFVSVLNGQHLKELYICNAKERFVDELQASGIEYAVIRPNGFFSDMKEFLEMAQKGRIYVFGDGEKRINPIHGEDLAKVCTAAIDSTEHEIQAGGPDTYSHLDIARLAFETVGKPASVTKIPDLFRRIALTVLRTFTPVSVFGPPEFFLTVLSIDMLAPESGDRHLKVFFRDSFKSQSCESESDNDQPLKVSSRS